MTRPWAALWLRNPVLFRLLAASPWLAMSHSVGTALGIGLATLAVTALGAPLLALLVNRLPGSLRLAAAVLLIATLAACVELLLLAFRFPLYQALGIYVPLIAATALLLLIPDGIEQQVSARDGLTTGLGFLIAVLLLSTARELLALGTLFGNLGLLFGDGAADWELRILPEGYRFPFWALPAGGFVAAGFLVALHRSVQSRRSPQPVIPATRARVTDRLGRAIAPPPD